MTKKIEVKIRKPATQTQRIRRAMKAHPDLTPKQIADIVGVKPRAVHMVKYLDKKRGTQVTNKPNNTPKRVVEKKGSWSPATPSHSPAWAKRNLANEMDAVKQRIEEIKASNPDSGARLSLWEIVGICIAVVTLAEMMRLWANT